MLISENYTLLSPCWMAAIIFQSVVFPHCWVSVQALLLHQSLQHLLPFFLTVISHSAMKMKCTHKTLLFILPCYFIISSLNYSLGLLPFSVYAQFPGELQLTILYVYDFKILFPTPFWNLNSSCPLPVQQASLKLDVRSIALLTFLLSCVFFLLCLAHLSKGHHVYSYSDQKA